MKTSVSGNLGGTSNPKLAAGLKKAGLSHSSSQVIYGLAKVVTEITSRQKYEYVICNLYMPAVYSMSLGMMDGTIKYGRHNFRIAGVNTDTYYDATGRHIAQWWYREDIDQDAKGGLSHIAKDMSSIHVLLDALTSGRITDNRPPNIGMTGHFETKTLIVPKKLKASTAYAEIMYHLMKWWEGENFDVRSHNKTHHLYLAMAWMHELFYAIEEKKLIDDRPPALRDAKWMEGRHKSAVALLEARGDKPIAEPFTQVQVVETERRKKFAETVMASIEDDDLKQKRVVAMKKVKKPVAVVPVITQLIPKKKKPTVMSVKKKKSPKAKKVKSKKKRAPTFRRAG